MGVSGPITITSSSVVVHRDIDRFAGLLPLLKSIQRPTELKKLQGKTLGVDAYGWLHRAAYSCATELAQDKPTDRFINAAMHRVRMLRHFGVKPYLVFDGDYLPSKAATEDSRAKSRDEKRKLGMELLKAGKPSQAAQEFQKCIDITPEMASTFIHQLKKMDIPFVVAPYEADAQLVYLERKGLVDGIISDDSDLLVFGAKRLLTKLDRYGSCIEINRRDFCACREISLTGWSDAEFRRMAILSGCDYLEGLPSVGLKTAYRMLRKSKTPEKVVRMLQFQGKRVSENYLTQFYQAELTFLHQWVFCPEKQEVVHLTELDGTRSAEEMPYIGAYVETELARAIAKGDINPITKAPIVIAATPTKRRHSQTTTAAAAPSQPPTKPINSYFKSHQRIPMGAMEPNCFSVDPQRLSQLTDGGQAPRVFPLPRPYLEEATHPPRPGGSSRNGATGTRTSPRPQRRRTEPISNMLSQMNSSPSSKPTSSTSTLGSSPAVTTPKSETSNRPSKKARLCEDDDIDQDDSPKRSKFFGGAKPRKSPRKAMSDAYLLSDDSIDKALQELPGFEGFKPADKGRKTIEIFEEPSQTETPSSSQATSQTTSQDTTTTIVTEPNFSQQSVTKDEPDLPPKNTSMPPPKPTDRLSLSMKTPAQSQLKRFSYMPTASSATPASAATSARSSVFSVASTASTAPSSAASSRLTPLQRIGARAFNAPASPNPRQSGPSKPKGAEFVPGVPVNPAFVSLPKVDLEEVEALNKPFCGSEDQIVPDSEGELDEDLEAAPPTKLNLSRFAFT